ncbi:MAG: hypothetical protein WBM90_10240 [Acidimicrobiia bacterium]
MARIPFELLLFLGKHIKEVVDTHVATLLADVPLHPGQRRASLLSMLALDALVTPAFVGVHHFITPP